MIRRTLVLLTGASLLTVVIAAAATIEIGPVSIGSMRQDCDTRDIGPAPATLLTVEDPPEGDPETDESRDEEQDGEVAGPEDRVDGQPATDEQLDGTDDEQVDDAKDDEQHEETGEDGETEQAGAAESDDADEEDEEHGDGVNDVASFAVAPLGGLGSGTISCGDGR